jgi:hypothetical protein
MAKIKQVIWVKCETKYFCKMGWTQHRVICLGGKINQMIFIGRNHLAQQTQRQTANIQLEWHAPGIA